MSKKLILFFVAVIFFSSVRLVFASLFINEIMYDLSGSDSISGKSREWVEVYNSGSDVSIDASKWRIYDGSANRTINDQVNFIIPAGAYIIFAGDKDTFLADNPSFSGTVYDTGITSLNNTGTTLKILDQDGNVADSVTYSSTQGGAGDGNSLQKISNSWVGATPTPGTANSALSSSAPASGGGTGLVTNNSTDKNSNNLSSPITQTQTQTTQSSEGNKIETEITAKTLAFAGIPITFEAKSFQNNKEQLHFGKYFWNFDDGDSKEVSLADSKPFTHTYFYPGDYIVSLDYYQNAYSNIPDTSNQITVKIIPTDITISKVGDYKDFFIELMNNTDYNADLSNWILASDNSKFILPRNTILASKKSIIISSKVSNFSILDKDTLKLMTPQGETVFEYSAPVFTNKMVVENSPVVEKVVVASSSSPKIQPPTSSAKGGQALSGGLTASAISSDVAPTKSSFSYMYIILAVFLGAASYGIYFIRQKRVTPKTGDDFEILDE